MKEKRETRVGDKEREKDRKRDRGSRDRKTGVEYRDRGSHRERKIKRKIELRGRETGMGERTIE